MKSGFRRASAGVLSAILSLSVATSIGVSSALLTACGGGGGGNGGGGLPIGPVTGVGVADPAQSTVAAAPATPATVLADGNASSTVTVTVKNSQGAVLQNATVVPEVTTGGATGVTFSSPAPTASTGVTTFTVKSTVSGVKVITVKVTAQGSSTATTLTQTASITFAPVASQTQTTFAGTSTGSIVADNSSTSTLTVTVKDAQGAVVANQPVTLAFTGTILPGATLSATSGTTDANGVVTVTVKSTQVGSATITATVTPTATGVAAFTLNLTVQFVPGPLNRITMDTPNASTAGVPFSAQARFTDAFGNTITSANGMVSVEVEDATANGATPPNNHLPMDATGNPNWDGVGKPGNFPDTVLGATIAQNICVQSINGVATFTSLTLNTAANYRLRAHASNLAETVSGSFSVGPNVGVKLGFLNGPAFKAVENVEHAKVWVNAPQGAILDWAGNVATGAAAVKLKMIGVGCGYTPDTTGGIDTATTVGGIATFSGAKPNMAAGSAANACTFLMRVDTSAGATAFQPWYFDSAASNTFNVVTTANAALGARTRISTQPTTFALNTKAGSGVVTQTTVTVQMVQAGSNTDSTSAGVQYTMTLLKKNPASAATPTFTAASNTGATGAVTFTINGATNSTGVGKFTFQISNTATPTAIGNADPSPTTVVVQIEPGQITQLVWTNPATHAKTQCPFQGQPTNCAPGNVIGPAPQIAAFDANDNWVNSGPNQADTNCLVTLTNGGAGVTLGGTAEVGFSNGLAVFPNLNISAIQDGLILKADFKATTTKVTIINTAATNSTTFNCRSNTTTAQRLVVTTNPPAQTKANPDVIGVTGFTGTPPAIKVTAVATNGTAVTTFTGQITIAFRQILPAGTRLSGFPQQGAFNGGTVTVSAVNGVATWSDLKVNLIGCRYQFQASPVAAGDFATGNSNVPLFAEFDIRPNVQNSQVYRPAPAAATAGTSAAEQGSTDDIPSQCTTTAASTTITNVTNISKFAVGDSINIIGGGNNPRQIATITAATNTMTVDVAITNAVTGGGTSGGNGAITRNPVGVKSGKAHFPAPQIVILDQNLNIVCDALANTFTVTNTNTPAGTSLGGNVASQSNGVAIFSGLTFNRGTVVGALGNAPYTTTQSNTTAPVLGLPAVVNVQHN